MLSIPSFYGNNGTITVQKMYDDPLKAGRIMGDGESMALQAGGSSGNRIFRKARTTGASSCEG